MRPWPPTSLLRPPRGLPGLLVYSLLVLQAYDVMAQSPPKPEYEVKAAFLLNFVQFIQWPAGSFARPDSPIIIGILGDDPFGNVLETTFEGKTVDGRPLAVRRSRQVEALRSCHMVFVCRSERDHLGQILAALSALSVVTVSEIDDFAYRGGIINFYIEDQKVRFEINPEAARRRSLRISAHLLSRARLVGS